MENQIERYASNPLNYAPMLHLKPELAPLTCMTGMFPNDPLFSCIRFPSCNRRGMIRFPEIPHFMDLR